MIPWTYLSSSSKLILNVTLRLRHDKINYDIFHVVFSQFRVPHFLSFTVCIPLIKTALNTTLIVRNALNALYDCHKSTYSTSVQYMKYVTSSHRSRIVKHTKMYNITTIIPQTLTAFYNPTCLFMNILQPPDNTERLEAPLRAGSNPGREGCTERADRQWKNDYIHFYICIVTVA